MPAVAPAKRPRRDAIWTAVKPRHEIPEDVRQVVAVSAILSISEFRVFELAHVWWYGSEGDEKTIEGHFLPYMFGDTVPPWVRSFTRRVMDLQSQGRLDPAELGIEASEQDPRDAFLGKLYAFAVAMSMVALVILIKLGGY